MKHSLRKGFSFGLTSAAITTLGMIIGLNSASHSKLVVIGGILSIAIADAFSDALGIHISEESENKHSQKEIWESTIATFVTKFGFALTFLIPILLFNLTKAIYICLGWGLLIITCLSWYIAEKNKKLKVIGEHLMIAIIVIIITRYVGLLVGNIFG